MVEVVLQPSARMLRNIQSVEYTTTDEDRPPGKVILADYPRIGDDVYDPDSGRSWTVTSVNWPINGGIPLLFVE